MEAAAAIGVFDSGLGGLTVLRELAHRFPDENFIYLGDTARLPYGSKSPETIRKYSEQNISFLRSLNVKAIVIACNSASTQMREEAFEGLPIYNVIDPGARTALSKSNTKRIGILGTRATVDSGAYQETLKALDVKSQFFAQACPLFVPLAEEGWDQDPITNLIVFRYLQIVLQNQVDVLIMGCTHYPLLKNAISRAAGSSIELVDSGEAMADWLQSDFNSGRLKAHANNPDRKIEILTTDYSKHFSELGARILKPLQASSVRIVDL